MVLSLKRKKSAAPDSFVELLLDGTERLSRIGYLGLVLAILPLIALAAIVLVVIIGRQLSEVLIAVLPWFFALVLISAIAGIALLFLERFYSLRLAEQKMGIILSVTEKMIDASIRGTDRIDSSQVSATVERVFKAIWDLDITLQSQQTPSRRD